MEQRRGWVEGGSEVGIDGRLGVGEARVGSVGGGLGVVERTLKNW